MIDVSGYIQQLEILRIRLLARIDGYWWIDENGRRHMTAKQIVELYFATGYVMDIGII